MILATSLSYPDPSFRDDFSGEKKGSHNESVFLTLSKFSAGVEGHREERISNGRINT